MTTPRKKLIEVALPLEAINAESSRRKQKAPKGYPTSIHKWWAQVPIAAARAVLFAQLVDDPSAWPERFPSEEDQKWERVRLHQLIEELVPWEASTDERVLDRARVEIARSLAWGRGEEPPTKPEAVRAYLLEHAPPVYDPFCGGGSIPLEAQRLGLRAIASDLNPVAVMITKALIEFPPKFAGQAPVNPDARAELARGGRWQKKGAEGLAEDVRFYGRWMRDEAEKRIGHLYPKARLANGSEATVIAWLWARTVRSPNPAARGAHVPLVSSFMLSTKAGKEAWVAIVPEDAARDGWRFEVRTRTEHGAPPAEAKTGTKSSRGSNFVCALTGMPIEPRHIKAEGKAKRLGARLMAIVAEGKRSRVYLAPNHEHEAVAAEAKPTWRPEQEQPKNPRWFSPPDYGMTTFGDLFTDRQLVALTTFSDLVGEARAKVVADAQAAGRAPLAEGGQGARAYADAVAFYLCLVLSRVVHFNTVQCRWLTKDQAISMGLGQQAIPMTWDYCEGNPFGKSSAEVRKCTETIASCLDYLPKYGRGDANQLIAQHGSHSDQDMVICTDPPYYDNVGYADLSDFFYVWLRQSLVVLTPDICRTVSTPKTDELIATPYRHGSKDAAEQFFLTGMVDTFHHFAIRTHIDFPLVLYYAFKQEEKIKEGVVSTGWATFLEAVIDSGFQVDGTWPLRTQSAGRLVAMGANALASAVILSCRKRSADAPTVSRAEFLRALRREMPKALATLQEAAIAPVDMAQASIGPGMAVFSRYAAILEADDSPMTVKMALALINQFLDEFLAEQEGDFDTYSRFAVTWFEQYGFDEGRYGEAEVVAQARNVSVEGVRHAGLLKSGGGKVRLLRRDELDPAWDIRTDDHVTVWECCQHLIRRLEAEGVDGAARLLKPMGHYGEMARDLAYRLFASCERRKKAEEARAYNGLVVAWPEIVKRLDHVAADPLPGQDDRQAELTV